MTKQLNNPSNLTHEDLARFGRPTTYYDHPMVFSLALTDGTKFLAEKGRCSWLFDTILWCQQYPVFEDYPEQFWRLDVREDRSAILRCSSAKDTIVDSAKFFL